jgi:transcriptional regulator with XRE-family HTH domain
MRSNEHDRLYRLIGERVRDARERKGLTQTALAAKLKLSRVSVVNIECGRQRPPIHVLWQIGEHLGSEVSGLIPRHREYLEDGDGVRLDAQTIAQIEAAAKGDPATSRQLTEFIKKTTAMSRKSGDSESTKTSKAARQRADGND